MCWQKHSLKNAFPPCSKFETKKQTLKFGYFSSHQKFFVMSLGTSFFPSFPNNILTSISYWTHRSFTCKFIYITTLKRKKKKKWKQFNKASPLTLRSLPGKGFSWKYILKWSGHIDIIMWNYKLYLLFTVFSNEIMKCVFVWQWHLVNCL